MNLRSNYIDVSNTNPHKIYYLTARQCSGGYYNIYLEDLGSYHSNIAFKYSNISQCRSSYWDADLTKYGLIHIRHFKQDIELNTFDGNFVNGCGLILEYSTSSSVDLGSMKSCNFLYNVDESKTLIYVYHCTFSVENCNFKDNACWDSKLMYADGAQISADKLTFQSGYSVGATSGGGNIAIYTTWYNSNTHTITHYSTRNCHADHPYPSPSPSILPTKSLPPTHNLLLYSKFGSHNHPLFFRRVRAILY